MTDVEAIISCMEERVQWFDNDFNTFIFIRSKIGSEYLGKFTNQDKLGGGNLLILLGGVCIISLLAKVHYVLSQGKDVINRDGTINETKAFIDLVQKFPSDLGFGKIDELRNESDIKRAWKDIRHQIVHQATVKNATAVALDSSKQEYPLPDGYLTTASGVPFMKNPEGRWIIYTELLKEHIKNMWWWLRNDLRDLDQYATNNIQTTREWLDY